MNIDDVDCDLLQWSWKPDRDGYLRRGTTHTISGIRTTERLHMHRIIGERIAGRKLTKHEVIDHINHNITDNRRENLRITTWTGNSQNRTKRKSTLSRYIGVTRLKYGKWQAGIQKNGKWHYLGVFEYEDNAAEAYNRAAERLGFLTRNIIVSKESKP